MPSFRLTMTIGLLRPDAAPEDVLPHAANATAELATLESRTVTVVSGEARIVIRFTADDAEEAARIAAQVVEATATLAQVLAWRVTGRVRGRWADLVVR
ncbi:hypothetical protein [Actinoalloteichus hymeniacidonis]|uniref:Uncharacterized protein n=1 Tax=Actinoalloteichus hymeniacidonis TaxID=340345 RepID=A0AAC9HSA1_9PSEU|nr:hypothetical protein [Actinoalloteichus hymeniacidonis]AOS63530.1 hypothetical protein TL08_13580 [Actinoalloteichus hymeniacidonis]MBB5908426.1 hypothetical protein [Actinoalloteichus hymeniacidonis]